MKIARFIRVAKQGQADFGTIAEALASIPADYAGATVISIASGIYFEKLRIGNPCVTLTGDGKDSTVIRYDDHALRPLPSGEPMNTFNSYTLYIGAPDFEARDLCVENSGGDGRIAGQAIACYVDADRAVFRNCRFAARQDTLCLGPLPDNPLPKGLNLIHPAALASADDGRNPFRHYFRDCHIEGDVDFIFGSASAVFERCEIKSLDRGENVNGYIAAPSTLPRQTFGFVFLRCRLTGSMERASVFLARPWRRTAKAAFIDCRMGSHIAKAGWDNGGNPDNEKSAAFVEYGSHGPGAPGRRASDRRASWARSLSTEEAATFSPRAVLSGADGWNPWVEISRV